MAISLQRRRVGDVNVVACGGKLVGGPESDELQSLVDGLLPLEPHVVLNVADVTFMDSAGVGVLVRLLHRTRRHFGDLKLCHVPGRMGEVLRLTRLLGVFDVHPGEEEAISAFYGHSPVAAATRPVSSADVLCVDDSPDLLAYVCGVLREAGFHPMPCGNIADAAVLLKVSRPRLLIIGASARARLDAARGAADPFGSIPVLDLPPEFASRDPVESSRELVSQVRTLAGEPA